MRFRFNIHQGFPIIGHLFYATWGYPQIDWKKAMGLRDIIRHQYFDINAAAIFDVCRTKIKPLMMVIETMLNDLQNK